MNDPSRLIYTFMAAIAGSITSLSFLPWRQMTRPEVGMTLFVGASFAIFGVPWLLTDVGGMRLEELRAICGVTYFGATFANALIPLVLKRFKRMIGLDEEAAK